MTAHSPISAASSPAQIESRLSRIVFFFDVLVSVTVCYIVFGCFRLLDGVLSAIGRTLYGRASLELVDRRATAGVALAGILLLIIVAPWQWATGAALDALAISRIAALTALLPLLHRILPAAIEVPATLEEIRYRVRKTTFESWVAARMRNPLDAVWLAPLLAVLAASVPAWLGLVLPGATNMATVVWYATTVLLCAETIATFEHANGHYRFFRPQPTASTLDRAAFSVLRVVFEQFLDLMLARIPRWYGVEHVLVHHVEDNGPADLQSTEPYNRESFIDFARCANRFALSGMLPLDVIRYLFRHRRWAGLKALLWGLGAFYITLVGVGFWNVGAVVVLLGLRYANLIRGSLTFFQEHGLIDVADPKNIYRNSLHYINRQNSHASLGEDPHIEHHLHPGRHWSEYIDAVRRDMQRYASEGAVGFLDGPGCVRRYYQLIWAGQFRELATMFIAYGREDASSDEIAAVLRARTQPVGGAVRSAGLRGLDIQLGRAAGHLLI